MYNLPVDIRGTGGLIGQVEGLGGHVADCPSCLTVHLPASLGHSEGKLGQAEICELKHS